MPQSQNNTPKDLTQYPYTNPQKQPPKISDREKATAAMLRCWRVQNDALQHLANALKAPAPIEPSPEFIQELNFMLNECGKRLR